MALFFKICIRYSSKTNLTSKCLATNAVNVKKGPSLFRTALVTLYLIPRPFLDGIPVLRYYANSADPVQTPQNAASDQCQYHLLKGISIQNTIQIAHSPESPQN